MLLSTDLITNFKPNFLLSFNKIDFLKIKTNQIFCKNFFLFLLLLKYKVNFFSKSTIFVKPYKKKIFTILKSPYRHKLARHQISLKRYEIKSTIKFKMIDSPKFKNFSSIIIFFKNVNKYLNWFESNIIFVHKSKINFNFFYKNNFMLNDYKQN